jgi:cystathionine beta-lyase family protein involved in aluminum resistance
MKHKMYEQLGLSNEVIQLGEWVETELEPRFSEIDNIAEHNQLKVLSAMQSCRLSDSHFTTTTGYGYNDIGRDTLEEVYASVFHTEAALVRPQIMSGTHALTLALSGNLRPGDEILAPAGKLYDTLQGVIGIQETPGSLAEYGITYRQVDLMDDGCFDYENIKRAIHAKTKLISIQKSKGYDWRDTFSNQRIGELIEFIRQIKEDVIILVDNCYGEFVEYNEPSDLGADLVVGSLIKNPGGGIAPSGGYIAGKEVYVNQAAYRLSAPGLGKEVGASHGLTHAMFQGLFLAPTVVASAHKTALFAAKLYEKLGFNVIPKSDETRFDIIQAIDMGTEEKVVAFCRGIQGAAPVDSYVSPEPWDMPGYDAPVIMAAGAFIQGSSIELSADAPIKPPFTVYFQGGLTYYHGKFGILKSLQSLIDDAGYELPKLS